MEHGVTFVSNESKATTLSVLANYDSIVYLNMDGIGYKSSTQTKKLILLKNNDKKK